MLREVRQIGANAAAAVVIAAALVTFGVLTLLGDSEDTPSGVTNPPAASVAPPPPSHRPEATDLTTIGPDGRPQGESAAPEAEGPEDLPAPRPAHRASLARMVGTKIMTPMIGTSPSSELLARVRRGDVGGVILFGENVRSVGQVAALTGALQSAARAGGQPPLLIATDQEGGIVKRFSSAPPTASAAQMGAAGGGYARRQGAATGQALAQAGVNLDLAPVADVTPRRNFLGSRSFGASPRAVAAAACGFAGGLRDGGVAATLKHFPGLGYATGNTDAEAVAIPVAAPALRSGYAAYQTCANEAGVVMVSNAAYPALDGSALPAVLSPTIIRRELRRVAGFRGVVVSDAFGAPGPAAHADAAVRAANAGVDMLLWGPGQGPAAANAYRQMLVAARSGRISRGALRVSAARLRALREELG